MMPPSPMTGHSPAPSITGSVTGHQTEGGSDEGPRNIGIFVLYLSVCVLIPLTDSSSTMRQQDVPRP